MKKKEKQSKVLYILYIYISISRRITWCFITWFSENKLPRAIYKENYKTKYLRLFTHFPNLITKESYNWWLTRRRMEIYTKNIWRKISKSVGPNYREALRTISQVKTRSARFRKRTKRVAKSLRSKRLISQRCEVGFQLTVFGFQRVTTIRKLQEEFHSTVQNDCEIISQQKGDFAAVQNSSFSLEWLACNGCNSFISTPNCAPFEALDCWLPEIRNDI